MSRRQFAASIAAASSLSASAASKEVWLYVGAYTNDKNKGITAIRFNMSTGALSGMKLAAETPNPTFLELHPSGKYLYAVNEIDDYEGSKPRAVFAPSPSIAKARRSLCSTG